MNLHNYAFNNYELVNLKHQGTLRDIENEFYDDKVFINRDVLYPLTKEEQENVRINISLQKPQEEWEDLEKVPNVVGKLSVKVEEREIADIDLF